MMFINRIALVCLAAACLLGGCASPNPYEQTQTEAETIVTTPAPEGAVPAGTLVMVRATQAVDSSRHGAGHRFTLVLEGALADSDGKVVVPKGSTVYGQLEEAKSARRLAGKSEVSIAFTGIRINNQIKRISATGIEAATEGSGKSTARNVAGGAAIGGIAGGSDKARKGAALGLGASMLTKGNQVRIAPGTILQFQLADHLVP